MINGVAWQEKQMVANPRRFAAPASWSARVGPGMVPASCGDLSMTHLSEDLRLGSLAKRPRSAGTSSAPWKRGVSRAGYQALDPPSFFDYKVFRWKGMARPKMKPRLGGNIGPIEGQVTVRSVDSAAWVVCTATVGPVCLYLLRAEGGYDLLS